MMKDKKHSKIPKQNIKPVQSDNDFVPGTDSLSKELIQSALNRFLVEKLEERNITKKNLEALISVVEEFLNCFLILGYTFEGTPVQYLCAHTQQEADSLATLVNKFLITAASSSNS